MQSEHTAIFILLRMAVDRVVFPLSLSSPLSPIQPHCTQHEKEHSDLIISGPFTQRTQRLLSFFRVVLPRQRGCFRAQWPELFISFLLERHLQKVTGGPRSLHVIFIFWSLQLILEEQTPFCDFLMGLIEGKANVKCHLISFPCCNCRAAPGGATLIIIPSDRRENRQTSYWRLTRFINSVHPRRESNTDSTLAPISQVTIVKVQINSLTRIVPNS